MVLVFIPKSLSDLILYEKHIDKATNNKHSISSPKCFKELNFVVKIGKKTSKIKIINALV